MFKVIYTKSLEDANDVVAESWEYKDKKLAVELFKERINKIMSEILDNSIIHGKIDICRNKAIIKIESIIYVIAIVDDMNNSVKI